MFTHNLRPPQCQQQSIKHRNIDITSYWIELEPGSDCSDEYRRTRPHGELGPSQNSAPWRSRPCRDLGPTENSAPYYRGELGPHCGELGPNWNSRPSTCLVNMALQHIRTSHHCIHFHRWIVTYEQSHMVLGKAVEDGFTHFYRKCGQRSAQPLSTRDCHFAEFPQLRTMA